MLRFNIEPRTFQRDVDIGLQVHILEIIQDAKKKRKEALAELKEAAEKL
jgi:hypothetical protein